MAKEDWLAYSTTLFTFAVIFLFCYIRHVFTFFERNRVVAVSHPTFPFGDMYPIVSGSVPMSTQLWKFYNRAKRKKAKIGGFYVFSKPAVVIADPLLIKAVLLSEDDRCRDRLGDDRLLVKISQSVRFVWSEMLQRAQGEEVNFTRMVGGEFTEMIAREVLNVENIREVLPNRDARGAVAILRKLLSMSYVAIGTMMKSENCTIRNRKENNGRSDEILEILLDDNVPRDEFVLDFIHKLNISNNLVLFALHELAHNEEIQNDLRGEMQRFVGNRATKNVHYKDLDRMAYFESVVCETLRKYPVSPFIFKVSKSSFTEIDANLHEGLLLFISAFGLHHDADNYTNPELFDPDRFSEENEKFIDPIKYLPFGCKTPDNFDLFLVKLLMKLTLMELLLKFKFSLGRKSPKSVQFDETFFDLLKFKEDLWLKISNIR